MRAGELNTLHSVQAHPEHQRVPKMQMSCRHVRFRVRYPTAWNQWV